MSIEQKFRQVQNVSPPSKHRANRELLSLMTSGQKKDVGPGPEATYSAPGIKKLQVGFRGPGIANTTPPDPSINLEEKRMYGHAVLTVQELKKHQPKSKGTFDAIQGASGGGGGKNQPRVPAGQRGGGRWTKK